MVFIATLSHHVIIVESATVTAQEVSSNYTTDTVVYSVCVCVSECVCVCSCSQIIHHTDVSHALDLEGVANRGLFLRQESEGMSSFQYIAL